MHVPDDLARVLPNGSFQHTCDLVDFTAVRGQRCLIIGGRQSAFEWAALMCEAGAAPCTCPIAMTLRRSCGPTGRGSIRSWTAGDEPGWYGSLTQIEKDALSRRLWAEGRLKLEPWLARACNAGRQHLAEYAGHRLPWNRGAFE